MSKVKKKSAASAAAKSVLSSAKTKPVQLEAVKLRIPRDMLAAIDKKVVQNGGTVGGTGAGLKEITRASMVRALLTEALKPMLVEMPKQRDIARSSGIWSQMAGADLVHFDRIVTHDHSRDAAVAADPLLHALRDGLRRGFGV